MPGIVKFHRTRFTEDEISIKDESGQVTEYADIPYDDDHTTTEIVECEDVAEAVRVIRDAGLTFGATGGGWAANPDGTTITDYATGEREDVSAHLEGWSVLDEMAITAAVDAEVRADITRPLVG
jgi:hypothetical protein